MEKQNKRGGGPAPMWVNRRWQQEHQVVTRGGGLKLDGVFGKIICPPVFSLSLSFFFKEVGVSLSAHPRATNYNSHVTHSTHNKS